MFSTLRYPYHNNQLYGFLSRISSRDRYLAALAEARAAEAEFIAEEEARREEERHEEELALRRRLEEIQATRTRHISHLDGYNEFSLHHRHSYGHNAPAYPSEDRLTRLRREMGKEELRSAIQKKLEREREREAMIRKEAQIIARKRKEEENRLELIKRQREHEEKKLLELRRAQSTPTGAIPTGRRSHSSHPVYFTLGDFLGQLEDPRTRPVSDTKATSDVVTPQDLLNVIFGETGESSYEMEKKPTDAAPVCASASNPATAPKPTIQSKPANDTASFNPEDFVKLLFGLGSQFMDITQREQSSAPQASSSTAGPSGSRSSSSTSTSQPVQVQQAGAVPNVAAPIPKRPAASSIKDELEARLYSDHHTEIRDTIQAILASLADATTYEQASAAPPAPVRAPSSTSTSSPTSSTGSSSKGKEKAEEVQPKVESEATSRDVVNAMDTVNTIEAAFLALQQDFTFPSQLDFTPPSSRPSSPVSDTLSSKLAYTSRNHPLRYYEQSLSGLLAQLDGVESFGSGEVRLRRKEVVEKVEGAIEELEREVEGRWKSRVAKEEKEKEAKEIPQPTSVAVTKESAVVPTPQEQADPNNVESTKVNPKAATTTIGDVSSYVETTEQIPAPMANVLDAEDIIPQSGETSAEHKATENTQVEAITSAAKSSAEAGDAHHLSESVPPPSRLDSSSYPSSTSSYPPVSSVASSVATVRPNDVDAAVSPSSEDIEGVGAFLFSASAEESNKANQTSKKEEDVGSDWSEVEA